MDAKGAHAQACQVGGWKNRTHDAAVAVLKEWCEDCGCQVQDEQVLVQADPSAPERRMDLIVHAPTCATPIYIDITIVDPASVEALARGAASQDGTAAAVAEKGKRDKYPLVTCTPFAVETHGRLGQSAIALAKRLAPRDLGERSLAIRRLYQAMSATIQRRQADAVIAAMSTGRGPASSAARSSTSTA